MSDDAFLSPRLIGPRFERHAIPLEFLRDLAVLEELIIEVAKAKYLEDNPDRKRSPRGWTNTISIELSGVKEGSAIPVIKLAIVGTASLFAPEAQGYAEAARDSIVTAISAAERNQSVTDHLPEKTLSYFDRFGRSLRDSEAIEFTVPGQQSPARLTKESRRRLVLASTKVQELSEETMVRGRVCEADQEKMTCDLQLFDGRRVKAPIATPHLDTILDAFKGYREGARVLLKGIGKFNRTNQLKEFESIEQISILDELDTSARLDEFRTLKAGWLEGVGTAPSHEGLDWLSQVFEGKYPDDLPLPYLYPTENGGVQAEWSMPPYEVTLEIDLNTQQAEWHQLNMQDGNDAEEPLDLSSDDGWQALASKLRALAGGQA